MDMEHVTLTPESVLVALEAIVATEGEDYVYEPSLGDLGFNQCFYVRDGKPSCIVGRVLAAHGVPLDRLKAYDTDTPYGGGGTAAEAMINDLRVVGLKADPSLARSLGELQSMQDSGYSWGDVLETAHDYLS